MRPILKYRGGKYKEIEHFINHVPKDFNTYIEPFVGGGALYFYLEKNNNIINDINEKLIAFYLQLRDSFDEVKTQLTKLQAIYEHNQVIYDGKKGENPLAYIENKNEALYYKLRNEYNNPNGEWLEAVVYYFINKTSYNGMIRYNKNGNYNVPYGRYRNFNTNLITTKHRELLKNTIIHNKDYADVFKLAGVNDFIFLDPPYHQAIFNDYGNPEHDICGFTEDEHKRLAKEYSLLKCKALMVISKTDLTKELYNDYIVDEYGKSYSVNIRNRFKNEAKHLIVKNY